MLEARAGASSSRSRGHQGLRKIVLILAQAPDCCRCGDHVQAQALVQ